MTGSDEARGDLQQLHHRRPQPRVLESKKMQHGHRQQSDILELLTISLACDPCKAPEFMTAISSRTRNDYPVPGRTTTDAFERSAARFRRRAASTAWTMVTAAGLESLTLSQ